MNAETDDHPICGRCLGEVPCGCYSHEAYLGLPYPSPVEDILEAYREDVTKLHKGIRAARDIDPADHATTSRDYGRGFAEAIRRVREALPPW